MAKPSKKERRRLKSRDKAKQTARLKAIGHVLAKDSDNEPLRRSLSPEFVSRLEAAGYFEAVTEAESASILEDTFHAWMDEQELRNLRLQGIVNNT